MFSYIETSPILLAFFAGMLVGNKESIHCQVFDLIQNHINDKFSLILYQIKCKSIWLAIHGLAKCAIIHNPIKYKSTWIDIHGSKKIFPYSKSKANWQNYIYMGAMEIHHYSKLHKPPIIARKHTRAKKISPYSKSYKSLRHDK